MPTARARLLAAALILAALSLSAALIAPAVHSRTVAVAVDAPETVTQPLYTLRALEGEICVYQGDTLIQRTGVSSAALPASDRELLSGGIAANSPAELAALLEDLTS